ncbi:MAG: hypothetical protein M1819_003823 [Sarea resinae]|nr:MAG: hypothetical protein M1819_003823 [Sarea resinae]
MDTEAIQDDSFSMTPNDGPAQAPGLGIGRKLLIAVIILALTTYLAYSTFPSSVTGRPVNIGEMKTRPGPGSCPQNTYDTQKRLRFGRQGAVVYGWPSAGGMLYRSVEPLELEFLGIDRFSESQRSQDPAEEDAFCRQLYKIGARWYEHERELQDLMLGDRKWPPRLEFGWPANGGVWAVRKVKEPDLRKHPLDPPLVERKPWGKLYMALNMEERCRVIEELGGTFFPNPEECDYLTGKAFLEAASEIREE